MKLLIVEDNPQMRRLIIQIVRKSSDAIFECEDGAEALSAYREHLPDWVLMDVEMREIDGITATRQIITNFPEAKIVIVTDYSNANLREAAKSAGACQFIAKDNLIDLRRLLAH
ncbi:MAG: response regulator transcription factor [Pyrinomonadaceae bacterium]